MKKYHFLLTVIMLLILSIFLVISCGGDSAVGQEVPDGVPAGVTITIPPGL